MNIEIVKRSDFKSFFDMKTRWKDMDALGHINNATFLTYLESGRIELVKKWVHIPPACRSDRKSHGWVTRVSTSLRASSKRVKKNRWPRQSQLWWGLITKVRKRCQFLRLSGRRWKTRVLPSLPTAGGQTLPRQNPLTDKELCRPFRLDRYGE